jgi:hypothetical protein
VPGSETGKLRAVAERIEDALPPVVEEVVLTGSVSRGVADEFSDIEMLIVTTTRLDLTECFEHARTAAATDASAKSCDHQNRLDRDASRRRAVRCG